VNTSLGMSALETAAGMPFGFEPPVSTPTGPDGPMRVLEDVLAPAVLDPPCRVAFSGGRDSSLVLAAATCAARRHGCPLPIAVTGRYRDSQADERKWQELVLDHLGLEEHVVVEAGDEHDLIGPVATAHLRRHGVLFPANAHIIASLFGETAGGTLLLGVGGDELLARQRWSALNDMLARRRRPGLTDPARLAVAVAPRTVQRLLTRDRGLPPASWLRPSAVRRVRALERRQPADPLRFDRAVRKAARSRALMVGLRSLRRVGDASGVTVSAPLLDDRFVAALAGAGGARGWTNRATVMRFLAQDLLPDALLSRGDKAVFTTSFFNEHTRRFAKAWSGGGLDTELVDPETVREAWLAPEPDVRSALLLQIAWLHDHRHEPEVMAMSVAGASRPLPEG
jgi:asparagine synthase (glutamine-hydrolysing)